MESLNNQPKVNIEVNDPPGDMEINKSVQYPGTAGELPVFKKKSKLFKVIAIISYVLAAVVLIVGVVFDLTQPIVEVALGQWQALKADNVQAAYDQYTSTSFKQQTAFSEFKAFADNLKSAGVLSNDSKMVFLSRQIENNRGELSGYVTTPSGKLNVVYQLVKESNGWRIEYMNFDYTEK